MSCQHEHGDFVDGIWICGQCWTKLPDRPARYFWESGVVGADGGDAPRRQMVAHCPIKTAKNGLTLGQFVGAFARRLIARTGFGKLDAVDYALDLLRLQGAEFASPDVDWDTESAWDLAIDDMEYWDWETGANQ